MKWIAVVLVCLCLVSPPASAWGRRAHAAIAALAESRLNPLALAQVRELLQDDADRFGNPSHRATLAAVASWPDEIREVAPANAYAGWHTRSNPVCGDALGSCRSGHCVDQLIIGYGAVLKDRKQSRRERNEALKWLVHLVGDLHQPMHSGVSVDGGGVSVAIDGAQARAGVTLHTLWDNDIGNRAVAIGPLQADAAESGSLAIDAPTRWMKEAREVSRQSVYAPLPGFVCGQRLAVPVAIDDAYLQQATTAARRQLERAATRLAMLLNELLGR